MATIPSSDAPCSSKGRKRCPETHQAILTAAAELLGEKGYSGVCIEAIAARAGVGKQTIYRWWPSKAAVILEAYANLTELTSPLPDRGSVQQDLTEFLNSLLTVLTTTPAGRVMPGLIAEAQNDPQVAASFQELFIANRRTATQTLLQRGIDRGELRPTLNLELAIDTLYGPIWYRLLLNHAPLSPAFIQELVEQLLGGMRVDG
ncbi:MAG: TetR/AcrR family transcriptional regulator [Oculatellaceae cyanobacterium Prado106]|jgi:AcrR family transcriptional regulator|nr:TetR/AcrR family transcriptional regulator [Oculatellaceae cyanobacterium Prado106]